MSNIDGNSGRQPEVEIARCTGCGRCVSACPERLLTLEVSGYRKHAVLQAPARCTRCLDCLPACPVGALGCASAR
ncbi:MAG TPA: 4Fe-4S ferredoxin [Geobacter sp.]|nr:4Fe-4S ferredoxin [Geobacter sp.]